MGGAGASGCAGGGSGFRTGVGAVGSGVKTEMRGVRSGRSEVTKWGSGVGVLGVEPLDGEDW